MAQDTQNCPPGYVFDPQAKKCVKQSNIGMKYPGKKDKKKKPDAIKDKLKLNGNGADANSNPENPIETATNEHIENTRHAFDQSVILGFAKEAYPVMAKIAKSKKKKKGSPIVTAHSVMSGLGGGAMGGRLGMAVGEMASKQSIPILKARSLISALLRNPRSRKAAMEAGIVLEKVIKSDKYFRPYRKSKAIGTALGILGGAGVGVASSVYANS